MDNISAILGLAVLGILGVFCLISALIGLIRGLKKTVASTVVIIVSAIISFIVTAIAFRPKAGVNSPVTDALLNLMGESDISELMSIPGAGDAINYYITLLVLPFVFVLLFVAIRFVLGIIMKICVKFIPLMNDVSKPAKRLGGLGVGLVNGFILCLIIFMPLLGTVDTANSALKAISEAEQKLETQQPAGDTAEKPYIVQLSATIEGAAADESGEPGELEQISEILSPMVDEGAGKVMLTLGGRLMYKGVASAKFDGEKVVLQDEVTAIVEVVSELSEATSSSDNGEMIQGTLGAVRNGIEKSPMLKNIIVGAVSSAAQSWQNGEDFMGMSKDSLFGENMGDIQPMIDAIIEILAEENKETIIADLDSISGFLVEIDECGLFENQLGTDAVVNKLAEGGVLTDILGTLDGNPHMLPLVDEMNFMCVRLIAIALDLPSEGDTTDPNAVTVDDIIEHMRTYGEITSSDRHHQSELIDKVMVEVAKTYGDINKEGLHVSDLIKHLGSALDCMNETAVYGTPDSDGNTATNLFLVAVIQSDKVSDSIGLNPEQMTSFATSINDGVKRGGTYSNITATVADSFAVFENMNADDLSNTENVSVLLKNITPETAGVLQEIVTPELMQNYGVTDHEDAKKSANAMSSLLGNMADYSGTKRDDETDDEFDARVQKEADATDKIITLAIKANDSASSGKPLFDKEGESGSLGLTATGVIDTFVDSEVASGTLAELTSDAEHGEDPLGLKDKGMGDGDRDEMTGALDEYRNNHTDDSEMNEKLDNIETLFGLKQD